ncbi:MAG TPA: NAD+ synthase [Solirubrobacteraceae bacterium]|jgi:NAD+ synthase (glutamine-hydrolysing)|nr:NAD+ synthase [Solirubrobacteraceae bacterium]
MVPLRIALCQMNATVGDIAGNAARIRAGIDAARAQNAKLVLFPELALTGYPPEDLLLREHFLTDAATALGELAAEVEGIVAVVGFPERAGAVYNAAAVLDRGAVRAVYRKVHLPNYGVFDEQRYFAAGHTGAVIDIDGCAVGITVCEDLWRPGAPAADEAERGARLIVNISASPYHTGKGLERERLFAQRAREHGAHIAFCGLVGGQDELVFDGHSFVLDPAGATIARAAQFEEELLVCELELGGVGAARPAATIDGQAATLGGQTEGGDRRTESDRGRPDESARYVRTPIAPVEAEVYAALCVGLRDYVDKNGFDHVVLGLSGGIDSALVACLAVDALGAERVSVAIMPSPYSSSDTQDDARALAAALDVRVHELPVAAAMEAYDTTLRKEFAGREADITEENLQARIRGNLLMALSNKFGWLVLTTGNKSEMSVGYTTLYGDLAGGFAVIKDVPKTLVYRLCEWRNSLAAGGAPIPSSIIARAPSAELRENQRDEDSLPPYPLLDRILHGYIELDRGREQLIADGLPAAEVDRTIRLVDLAEYKRRQAPPGIKITTRAFGRDRRMPITNLYRG